MTSLAVILKVLWSRKVTPTNLSNRPSYELASLTKWGNFKLPGCNGKTLEGSCAFLLLAFLFSAALLLAWGFPPSQALQTALIAVIAGAIAELLPVPVDDNLSVPAITALTLGVWA